MRPAASYRVRDQPHSSARTSAPKGDRCAHRGIRCAKPNLRVCSSAQPAASVPTYRGERKLEGVHNEHRRTAHHSPAAVRRRRSLPWWPDDWGKPRWAHPSHPDCHAVDGPNLAGAAGASRRSRRTDAERSSGSLQVKIASVGRPVRNHAPPRVAGPQALQACGRHIPHGNH